MSGALRKRILSKELNLCFSPLPMERPYFKNVDDFFYRILSSRLVAFYSAISKKYRMKFGVVNIFDLIGCKGNVYPGFLL